MAETGAIGWSATTLATGTADRYRALLAAIDEALVAFGHPVVRRAAAQQNKNGTAARCRCGRQFRITVSVLDLRPDHLRGVRRAVRRRADPGR